MKVYVLIMVDVIDASSDNYESPIVARLGVYKTKAPAQKDMRVNIRKDIESAREMGLDFEYEIGKDSAIITYDNGDYIEYSIGQEIVRENPYAKK